jgi:hypothetical protein
MKMLYVNLCFSDPEGVVSFIAGGVSLRKEDTLSFFKPRRGERF